jgi:hypothetical protein
MSIECAFFGSLTRDAEAKAAPAAPPVSTAIDLNDSIPF